MLVAAAKSSPCSAFPTQARPRPPRVPSARTVPVSFLEELAVCVRVCFGTRLVYFVAYARAGGQSRLAPFFFFIRFWATVLRAGRVREGGGWKCGGCPSSHSMR